MKLANKVALITGAGSGMGKSAALLYASEGAKVAAVDINEAQAKETADSITKKGGQVLAIRADVAKGEDVKRMVDETVAKFGGLNVLYNNAGIEGEPNFVSNVSEDQFDRVIAINLLGVFLGMKYALPPSYQGRWRLSHQPGIGGGFRWYTRQRGILRVEGRRNRIDARGGARNMAATISGSTRSAPVWLKRRWRSVFVRVHRRIRG